jgi:pimeloyl-ACP methyl ester carboxylesterase
MNTICHAVKRFALSTLALLLMGALSGCGPDLEAGPPDEVGTSDQEVGAHSRRGWGSPWATPKSIVLVHGSWGAGALWNDVAAYLRNQGHSVAVLDLTAHGSDPTPPGSTTLNDYVAKVSTAVHSLPAPVYLVGHSMAGIPISQYAENEPLTVKELIYYAAFLPQDGQSLLDLANQDPGSLINQYVVIDPVNGIAAFPPEGVAPTFCADCSQGELDTILNNYRDEPLAPLGTPVSLTAGNWGTVTKKYFFTSNDQAVTHSRQQAMASTVPLAKTITMNTSHYPSVSFSSQFADKLLTLMR